jgi:multimeric flavodoxin WrbA
VKVVAVQGSPHKGNTHDRVERFRQTLESLGDVEFEHIQLKDAHLEPCCGCFQCFARGEEVCPFKDDRAEIERRLGEADAVVFATPVYSMHVSYLMKTFVDRMAYTFHRPRYFGKYAVGLAVTGGVGLKETLGYLRMFAGAWGFEYVGDLGYADPPRGSDLPRFVRGRDETEAVAARLHDLVRNRPPRRVTTNDHLAFHAMRAVYGRMEDCSPTDYAYWKSQGWLDPGARYFTGHARVGLLKSVYPRLVARMMGRAIDRELSRQPGSEGGDE